VFVNEKFNSSLVLYFLMVFASWFRGLSFNRNVEDLQDLADLTIPSCEVTDEYLPKDIKNWGKISVDNFKLKDLNVNQYLRIESSSMPIGYYIRRVGKRILLWKQTYQSAIVLDLDKLFYFTYKNVNGNKYFEVKKGVIWVSRRGIVEGINIPVIEELIGVKRVKKPTRCAEVSVSGLFILRE